MNVRSRSARESRTGPCEGPLRSPTQSPLARLLRLAAAAVARQFLASQAIQRMRAVRVLVSARRTAAARRSLATSDGRRLALSFSGSGMMMAYHFGVAAAIAEKSSLMDRVDRVHGLSLIHI